MIVEQRSYTLKPGSVAEYLKLYEAEGLKIQKKHLGHLFGYFHTELGALNKVVQMWAYENMADRSKRRAALQADPAWNAYIVKNRPVIVAQQNEILIPAPFSPPLASGS
jgi:hypothetical protein